MTSRSGWAEAARRTLQAVNERLPADATLVERVAAVDAAYPFGERAYWPHKAWLKARRTYLSHYGWKPKGKRAALPLFPDLPRDPATGRPVIR